MGIFNKEWKAKLSNGSEIVIRNFVNFKESGQSIHIDGQEIYFSKRSVIKELLIGIRCHFKFDPLGNNINHTFKFENSVIDVKMGTHFFFLLKCIVKENTNYLIGNEKSQIYYLTPFFIWSLYLIIPFATAAAFLIIWIHHHIYIEILNSVKNDSQLLWKKDLRRIYDEKPLKRYLDSKLKEWETQCKAKNDHTCRLAGYVYSFNDEDLKEMEINIIPCYEANNLRSCYSIYVNNYFHRNNEDYYKLADKIYDLCLSSSLNEQEQETCIYFSEIYFKDIGDLIRAKELRNLHCNTKFEKICTKL